MILLIDNYDSFVHNLARHFRRLGQETLVLRNDAIDAAGVRELSPAAIVISPGPCTPRESGCSTDVVRAHWKEIPMLGVCLGHQAIATAMGGRLAKAPEPMHGRTSDVSHDGRGIFRGVPNPVRVCRYHSLVVEADSLPTCLEVSATTTDGVIMAVRHRAAPVVGLQFHPESILTQRGYQFLSNFLQLARLVVDCPPEFEAEIDRPRAAPTLLPKTPVTF